MKTHDLLQAVVWPDVEAALVGYDPRLRTQPRRRDLLRRMLEELVKLEPGLSDLELVIHPFSPDGYQVAWIAARRNGWPRDPGALSMTLVSWSQWLGAAVSPAGHELVGSAGFAARVLHGMAVGGVIPPALSSVLPPRLVTGEHAAL